MTEKQKSLIEYAKEKGLKLKFINNRLIDIYDNDVFIKKANGYKNARSSILNYLNRFKLKQPPYKTFAFDIAKRHGCDIKADGNNLTVYTELRKGNNEIYTASSYKSIYNYFKKIEEGNNDITKLHLIK